MMATYQVKEFVSVAYDIPLVQVQLFRSYNVASSSYNDYTSISVYIKDYDFFYCELNKSYTKTFITPCFTFKCDERPLS